VAPRNVSQPPPRRAGDPAEASDKSAILARRALFVASALASAGLAAGSPTDAVAQPSPAPVPDCPPAPSPTPEAVAESKLHFEAGVRLFEEGRFAEASEAFRQAYLLAPLAPLAFNIINADVQRGATADAAAIAEQHLHCVGPDPRIEEQLRGLQNATALVTVRIADPDRVLLEIDGAPVPTEQAARGLRLSPGRHLIRIARDGEVRSRELEVSAGEKVELSFDPLPPPQPCLSPLPCLQPPPPPEPEDTLVRLQGGVGTIVAIEPSDPVFVSGGPLLLVEVAVQPADGLWIQPGVLGGAALADESLIGLVGTSLDFEYRPVDVFGLGAGFAGGYLFASKSTDDPTVRVRDSGFFGPTIVPASIVAGLFYMEPRVPIWFSEITTGAGPHLGLGLVAPHVVFGIGAPIVERSPSPEAVAGR